MQSTCDFGQSRGRWEDPSEHVDGGRLACVAMSGMDEGEKKRVEGTGVVEWDLAYRLC